MRFLIVVYCAIGALLWVLSGLLGWTEVLKACKGIGSSTSGQGILLGLICFAIGALPMLAVYGLLRRWRITRLVLMGISLWLMFTTAVIGVAVLIEMFGVPTRLSESMADDPFRFLSIIGGCFVFGIVQWSILAGKRVAEQFK